MVGLNPFRDFQDECWPLDDGLDLEEELPFFYEEIESVLKDLNKKQESLQILAIFLLEKINENKVRSKQSLGYIYDEMQKLVLSALYRTFNQKGVDYSVRFQIKKFFQDWAFNFLSQNSHIFGMTLPKILFLTLF